MNDKPLCIYHSSCADGFGAAWVVRKAYGDGKVDFHPGKYTEAPPDVSGRDVLIVDFSYKRPVLLKMAQTARVIVILDHHKSAQEDLVDLPANVISFFDMNHSGAMLTWNYFFYETEPPTLIKHIQDRDLWRFLLPGTRPISANLFSYPYDFKVWDDIVAAVDTEEGKARFIEGGEALERKHFKDIKEMLSVTQRQLFIGDTIVPAANLPYIYSSDAGHIMSEGLKTFAACYWHTRDGVTFSLRSAKDGMDVSKIAEQYGGGGHRSAAGFSCSYGKAQTFEL